MRLKLAVVLAVLLVAAGAFNFLRPIPSVVAKAALPSEDTVPGSLPSIPWPSAGSSALGAAGLGLIGTSGNGRPVAAASVTKVMTALVVLTDKPLVSDETGATITITDADVQSYQSGLADNESVVAVSVGEVLSERQLLEGLLIPSANNFAETLARWDAGTIDAFVAKMNKRAADLHLTNSTFADTSGASPQSVSTPSDLMTLGMAAMRNQAFAQIVAMPQAQLPPPAGTVYNVDAVLGKSGIVGIKTGSGLPNGDNFLFAAAAQVDGHQVMVFGCVMGQPTLAIAFAAARNLVTFVQAKLHVRRVIARNQTVATVSAPWGGQADLLSTVDVDLVEWPGMILLERLNAPALVLDRPVAAGTRVGSEHVVLGDYSLDVDLVTGSPLYPPGKLWRLTRINFL